MFRPLKTLYQAGKIIMAKKILIFHDVFFPENRVDLSSVFGEKLRPPKGKPDTAPKSSTVLECTIMRAYTIMRQKQGKRGEKKVIFILSPSFFF